MTNTPSVVGINRTQDGSIAVALGRSTVFSLQKERISRRKHHWGRLGDLPKLYRSRMPWLDGPVDLVVEGWSSDAELDRIDEYHAELRETLQLAPGARIVQISHHVTHLAPLPSPTIPGGVQAKVQYSMGSPTETGITVSGNRFPRVVSWGVKWEQGPILVAFAQESHRDLFGGSINSPTARQNQNSSGSIADPSVNSVDTANQLAAVYKIGNHSIEADYVIKHYKEDNVIVNGRFQDYKNKAYMLLLESRWSGTWRTAVHYIRSSAGSCTLLNTACTTDGLEGHQIDVGVAYYLDPSVYIFGLYSKLTNGAAARYNSSSQSPNPGEDITQGGIGIAYTF